MKVALIVLLILFGATQTFRQLTTNKQQVIEIF